jgi:hypothetical protein
MGTLTLGAARAGVDAAEAGTFDQHAVYGIFGGASVFDPEAVAPGYTPATEAAPVAVNAAAGPTIDAC